MIVIHITQITYGGASKKIHPAVKRFKEQHVEGELGTLILKMKNVVLFDTLQASTTLGNGKTTSPISKLAQLLRGSEGQANSGQPR